MAGSSQSTAQSAKKSGPSGGNDPSTSVGKCKTDAPVAAKAQTIEPKIQVQTAKCKYHGKADPKRDEVGSVTLKVESSGDALGYKGSGTFTANNDNCVFYSDSKCKKKIDATGGATFKYGSLASGVTVYYKGEKPGPTDLSLKLDAASDARQTVKGPATGKTDAVFVPNKLKPELKTDKTDLPLPFPELKMLDEEIHLFQTPKPDAEKPPVAKVELKLTADISVEAYDKAASLSANNDGVTFWRDAECKKSIATPYDLTAKEMAQGLTVYVRGEKAGQTEVSLTLPDTAEDIAEVDKTPAKATLTVKAVNRITPYLRVEHLVVLKDPGHAAHQRKNDTKAGSAAADADQKIYADATRLELWAVQTEKKVAYAGKGALVFTPNNLDLFEDKECTKPFAGADQIDFAKLIVDKKPLEVFARGKTAGAFTAELRLEDPKDDCLRIDKPAKGDMGCAEIKLKLYHYLEADIDKAVNPDVEDIKTYWKELKKLEFEQKEMTQAQKAGEGRLLQTQKDGNCARAKLELECDEAHWPKAAKEYKIHLDMADSDKPGKKRSGGLKLFDKEKKGSEVKLPYEVAPKKVSGLKPFWVEGGTHCDGWRGIRLSVGFDRPDGGPAKTKKLDGDWAAFTVVNIKEVKCDLANEANQEKFVDGDKVFINLDANGRLLKTVNGKRKADVTAQIEPVLKDLDVHFMIVEHEDNFKQKKLPKHFQGEKIGRLKETVKPTDKPDRKKLLHVKKATDDKGLAKIETLQAPQFGLLKFKVGAYLMQNPEQARYCEGDSTLKKVKPTLSDKWFTVWRRLFFKAVAMDRHSGVNYADRFDPASIKTKLEETGLELEQVGNTITKPYNIALPDYHAWALQACGGAAPARTLYLGLINGRGDKGTTSKTISLGAPGAKTAQWNLKYTRFPSTTDKAKWLDTSTITSGGLTVDLKNDTTLTQTSDFQFQLDIDFNHAWGQFRQRAYGREIGKGVDAATAGTTADAEADQALASGTMKLKVNEAESSSGVSKGEAVIVCMDTREPDHAKENARDSATHTFLHEIGHYVGLAGKFDPDYNDKVNPHFYSEVGGEVSARGKGGYGKGPHCDGLNDKCIMWYSFAMTFQYCEACRLMLHARAYHSPKINGRDKF